MAYPRMTPQRVLISIALLAAPGLGGCGAAPGIVPVLRNQVPSQIPQQPAIARPSAQGLTGPSLPALSVPGIFLTQAGAQNPAYAPQGASLAYESNGQIILARPDGSQPRALTAGLSPAFSPDGHALAFLRHNQTHDAIIRFDLTTGMTQTLYDSPRLLSGFVWSPQGDGFILATTDGLERLSLGHGAPVPLWRGDGVSHPALSADGRFVMFDALNGSLGAQLARMPLAGGAPQFLSISAPHPKQSSLSPSGRSLAFIADDGLYIANADGSAAHRLTAGTGFANPVWNPKQPQIMLSAPHGTSTDLQAIALPSR